LGRESGPRLRVALLATGLAVVSLGSSGCAAPSVDDGASDSGSGSASSTDDDGVLDEPPSLVDWLAWQEADPLVDPWAEFRPNVVDCGLSGWFPEDENSIEVNTGKCSYATLVTPAIATARAGDELELWFWHYQLTAPEPAVGHAALEIDGTRLWEYEVAIPGDAFFLEERIVLDRDIEIGDPIYVHVRNHGQNSWTFRRIGLWAK